MSYENYIEALNERWEGSDLGKRILEQMEKTNRGEFGVFEPGTLCLKWSIFPDEVVSKYGCGVRLELWGTKINRQYADYNYAITYYERERISPSLNVGQARPKQVEKKFPNTRLGSLFGLEFAPYPVCCGLYQANNFYYNDTIEEDLIGELMTFTTKCLTEVVSKRAQRLFFIFVEQNSNRKKNLHAVGSEFTNRQTLSSSIIPPEDDATLEIQYPFIYRWARKQASYQELLQYNANSGNILHMASVVTAG